MSSYREGAGYGHGGYHSELPPAQLGDINIDPDEFPNVAQHLQHFHIGSHPAPSTTGSAGYPEDGARHLYVGPNGSHYYTSEVPGSTASYTGYNYIQAPDSTSAPHAFAGALRSTTDPNFHGMGYFDAWPAYPYPPTTNVNYPSQASSKRYSMPPTDAAAAAAGAYARPFPLLSTGTPSTATPTPQSAQSAFPPSSTQLSLPPPPSPAVSSSTNSSKAARSEQPFAAQNRRFSYDEGHTANLHDRIRRTYEQFMQGYEGRDRYDTVSTEGYPLHDPEAFRGRRPPSGYYKSSGDYIVPAGTIPRASTKTPSHADAGPSRRPATTAAIHQARPPPSRHSSSESGDAEPAYRPSGPGGRYDNTDYANPARPKVTKPRPNSFSYNRNDPRAIESDPSFRAYNISIAQDASSTPFGEPRSSTGSLGTAGVRYGTPAVVHQGDRYYRDTYGDGRGSAGGGAIVHSANSRQGRTYNYTPQRSQPINESGYSYYQAPEDRSDFDERRRRHRSKSRYRAQTPAPEERPVSEDERIYRISVAKSRPSSPSPPRRAKSRKRRDSPSPGRFRSKSRMRSRSRPRPEIIQEKNRRGDSPNRAGTPGSARPKTPMPEGVPTMRDPEEALRLKEIDRELNRIERERVDREKMERVERERAERQERERMERQERERIERQERERLERLERERLEKQEREKQERLERERLERLERENLERQERERQERERLEKQERERLDRLERERQEKTERERLERQERERQERLERERQERQERDKLDKLDRRERERLDRLEQERAEIRSRQQPRVEDAEEEPELPERPRRHRHRSHHRDYESRSTSSDQGDRDTKDDRKKEKERDPERKRDREREKYRDRERDRDRERERERERTREEAEPKITDPALANPMIENLNPKRERAGVQPGQVFIRPDLLCAMRALKLCVAEEDPSDDHAHNRLLRLDCGHGFHEDCLRGTTSSKERIPMYLVDLEAEKLWCERCRNYFGKKAGR
ncbi:hypothetical protein TWF696_001423 [Orbilia brochopaga]|uniref:Uncharacterized protein n=1 Tax=Orbilia brochopaga TaxID=3140254 RepID=A0AAV9U8T4_9PEZI